MLPLAVTMGEPAGVGAEIAGAAWRALRAGGPVFCLIDDAARVAALPGAPPVRAIEHPDEATDAFADALPVLDSPLDAPVTPGRPDVAHARAVIAAIDRAVALARNGRVAGVVTNPIQKSTLYAAGFAHPGHTEYLAALAGGVEVAMLLACPGLRTVPVTVHEPLRDALARLSPDLIVHTGRLVARALREEFGIAAPRLAVAGLNPHAGEGGALGHEDTTIVAPAVERLVADGILAHGPRPADTLFTPQARSGYDAAICLYHDQALIPVKTLDAAGGVNVTLGLPFVRTSPDHGTALDIAGTGRADPSSLVAAIRLAAELAARRGMA